MYRQGYLYVCGDLRYSEVIESVAQVRPDIYLAAFLTDARFIGCERPRRRAPEDSCRPINRLSHVEMSRDKYLEANRHRMERIRYIKHARRAQTAIYGLGANLSNFTSETR